MGDFPFFEMVFIVDCIKGGSFRQEDGEVGGIGMLVIILFIELKELSFFGVLDFQQVGEVIEIGFR